MKRTVSRDEIVRLFEKIQSTFPHLQMNLDLHPEHLDLDMEIPRQDGLAFHVNVNLQGDELHLSAGSLWGQWFPCCEQTTSDAFFNAVCGLLSGRWRVLEHYRGDKPIKAELQQPDGHRWRTVYTWSALRLPSLRRVRKRVLRNAQSRGEDSTLGG